MFFLTSGLGHAYESGKSFWCKFPWCRQEAFSECDRTCVLLLYLLVDCLCKNRPGFRQVKSLLGLSLLFY